MLLHLCTKRVQKCLEKNPVTSEVALKAVSVVFPAGGDGKKDKRVGEGEDAGHTTS